MPSAMTQSAYSTWPETAYALTLTRVGTWRRQRAVLELLSAQALGQGVRYGEIECSNRALATQLMRSERSHAAAGRVLRALEERQVLRRLAGGTGTAPSRYAVWHWTRWRVPWGMPEATAHDRILAFAASMRPLDRRSGSVGASMRSTSQVARGVSGALADLYRREMDPLARVSGAKTGPNGSASSAPRAADTVLTEEELIPLLVEEEEEAELRSKSAESAAELLEAVRRATGKEVFGEP